MPVYIQIFYYKDKSTELWTVIAKFETHRPTSWKSWTRCSDRSEPVIWRPGQVIRLVHQDDITSQYHLYVKNDRYRQPHDTDS